VVKSFERRKPGRAPLRRICRAACRHPGAVFLPVLRRQARQAGRGHPETLEVLAAPVGKVIQTVREKLSCRACGDDHPAAAPFHRSPEAERVRACWR